MRTGFAQAQRREQDCFESQTGITIRVLLLEDAFFGSRLKMWHEMALSVLSWSFHGQCKINIDFRHRRNAYCCATRFTVCFCDTSASQRQWQ